MAYELSFSQHVLANDGQFVGRVASIMKDQGYAPVGESGSTLAWKYAEDIAAEPGLAEAYHAALIADPPLENPGASNEVITDGMLTSAVVAVYEKSQAGSTQKVG